MMRRPRQPARRFGFTLFEILIAISALAILAAVVLPSFQSVDAQALESLARVVAADLRLARNEAIRHNTNYTVRFDHNTNSYEIEHTGSGSPPALRNPFAPPGTPDGVYQVELGRFGPTRAQSSGVRFAGAALADSLQTVTEVTFGPTGGTGPSRSEDTIIFLNSGSGTSTKSVRLTISWVTGQVWIDRATTAGSGGSG